MVPGGEQGAAARPSSWAGAEALSLRTVRDVCVCVGRSLLVSSGAFGGPRGTRGGRGLASGCGGQTRRPLVASGCCRLRAFCQEKRNLGAFDARRAVHCPEGGTRKPVVWSESQLVSFQIGRPSSPLPRTAW